MTYGIENQYAIVHGIDNVDPLLTIKDDTAWIEKFAIPSSSFPEHQEKVSFWVKLLHPIVAAIRHIDATLLIKGKVAGVVELSLSAFIFPVHAELEQQVPFGIELLNDAHCGSA